MKKSLGIIGGFILIIIVAFAFDLFPKTSSASGTSSIETTTPKTEADTKKEVKPEKTTDKEAKTESSKTPSSSSLEAKVADRFVGNKNAPVSVMIFSSFTCTHCKNFHSKVFAKLKEKYKDSKDVVVYFSDFPLDIRAASATMLSRCIPESSYWQFVDLLFDKQEILFADNYSDVLVNFASLAGLSGEEAKACIKDKEFLQKLLDKRNANSEKYKIGGTPTVLLVVKDKIENLLLGQTAEALSIKIDKVVAETQKKD